MTHRHAVMQLVQWTDLRALPARLMDASAALLRRRRWRVDRPAMALTTLSASAKGLLRQALHSDAKALRVPSVAGVAIGLELADVISISREPGTGEADGAFVLTVNPWAREQLRRRPELLD